MAPKSLAKSKDPQINLILTSLDELIYDQNSPNNIRNSAMQISKILTNGNGTIEQKKSHAIQLLEEMVSDINIDACTRTTLYNTISRVESLSFGKQPENKAQNIYK